MRFEHPNLLWLLLVIPPVLAVFFWWAMQTRARLMSLFIEARLLPQLTAGVSPARQKFRAALLVLAAALIVIALARPQYGYDQEEVHLRGLDIVVAMDVSKSMMAADIAPNRLARAKLAALDLMQLAKADRLGLVAFAGGGFLQCPLTVDETAFRQSVESLDVNIIPQGGTAVAEAITTALTAFKEGDSHKVLVLLTDGEDNDEGAVEAAKAAAKEGARIFTIGVGTPGGDMMRVTDAQGKTDFVRDPQGNVVKSHLNEELLKQIAAAGNGFYMPLSGGQTMDVLYERGIAPLPKTDQAAKQVKHYHERYHIPLALAVALLLLEFLFLERRKTEGGTFNIQHSTSKAKASTIALLAGLFLLPSLAEASVRSAMRDFKAGKYADAQKEYERLIAADKKGDLRLVYNAGLAAYHGTNYDAAVGHFQSLMTAPDVKLQQAAYYNLGNCLFRQGQVAKDLDGMQDQWENAIKCFQNAVTLDKNDQDAAYNLALTKVCVEKILALREAAKRAKLAADSATRQRNYHQAYEIMQQLLQTNPTGKQFEDFVKKLKDIDDIANPPPAPAP